MQKRSASVVFKLFFVISLSTLMASCSGSKENLPPASGASGDIFLVMDSAQWKGPLGDVMDSVFRQPMEVLPRKESIFHVIWIDPRKLNFVLKQRRNLIFAVTLDRNSLGARQIKGLFTKESLEKIKNDPSQFNRTTSNVFAKGQEVLYLFGNTEQELISNLRKNASRLITHFDNTETKRLTGSLYRAGQLKGIPELMRKNFDCEIRIPFGYQLVQDNSEFFWVRQINPKDDKDIFIARKKYISQSQFNPDSLIAFRNTICKKYLFEDPERAETYLITETGIDYKKPITREFNFRNQLAVSLKGLWRTNTLTMGGPFTGFALVDEGTGYFYYLEGFTYSPGKNQREILRELETILFTFRTSKELHTVSSK